MPPKRRAAAAKKDDESEEVVAPPPRRGPARGKAKTSKYAEDSSGSESDHVAKKSRAAPAKKAAGKASAGGKPLAGFVFAISGQLSQPRKNIEALIASNGGKSAGSVTAAVTHLLSTPADVAVGSNAKVLKAMEKDIPIVSEGFLDEAIAKGTADVSKFLLSGSSSAPAAAPSAKRPRPAPKKKSKNDDDDDEDDDDDDAPPPAKKPKSKPAPKKADDGTKSLGAVRGSGVGGSAGTAPTLKIKMKGSAPVDQYSGQQDHSHVLEENGNVYNCMLNQVNVGNNNNKFYVAQALERDDKSAYYCFTRWGRVGVAGQNKLERFSGKQGAIDAFQKKFREKTRNNWADRANFKPVAGKYTLLEMNYGQEEECTKVTTTELKPTPPCKLPEPLQFFINLIFDTQKMQATLREFEIDLTRMPLGNLTKNQVRRGYSILTQLCDILKANPNPKRSEVEDLTNQFYTNIPHAQGMQRLPMIDSIEKVKAKQRMIEALAEIEIATHIVKTGGDVHPIDQNYLALKTELLPLAHGSPEFNMVHRYMTNTHAATHNSYTLELKHVFTVNREGEAERFRKWAGNHNRMLLWHGSRTTNFVGILSQGLRIAPPEAPVTGYMFGKGVYFADMCSKSANYCRTSRDDPIGTMLLAEVALGDMYRVNHAEYMDTPRPGTHSTMGQGRNHPDPAQMITDENGMKIPLGTPVDHEGIGRTDLLYNEFIVYDVSQILNRYLLVIKFNHRY